jgi:trk system potassium uptake protein TrkA
MYIIIVGLGGIGENLARIAATGKHNVVAIDIDAQKCKDIATKYDLISVNGDATSIVILEEAGMSEADAVIATTGSDAVNLMVMLQAKEKGVKYMASIVNEREHIDFFKRTGAVIQKNPEALVAEDIYNTMFRPSINDFVSLAGGKAEILEIIISDKTHAAGKTIRQIGLPANVHVIAIERGEEVLTTDDDTVINPGDSVYVFVRKNLVDRIFNMFSVGGLVK